VEMTFWDIFGKKLKNENFEKLSVTYSGAVVG
jgi:hypothetical protein